MTIRYTCDFLAVERYVAKRVYLFEIQKDSVRKQILYREVERLFVHPVLLRHPLGLLLVERDERIGNNARVLQIGIIATRNGCRIFFAGYGVEKRPLSAQVDEVFAILFVHIAPLR